MSDREPRFNAAGWAVVFVLVIATLGVCSWIVGNLVHWMLS
jgi:hypothetical protein